MTNSTLPKLDRPNSEVPAAFREIAETIAALSEISMDNTKIDRTPNNSERISIEPADNSHHEMDESLDGTAGAEHYEADVNMAATSATAFNLKVFEAACINANAALVFAGSLLKGKSFTDIVALSAAHAQKQIEIMAEQTKQLAALAERIKPEDQT